METTFSDSPSLRTEKDLLGEAALPRDAYYGIHTLRARENFAVSGIAVHPDLIWALALVKKAAALANMETGLLDARRGAVIAQAAEELAAGMWRDQILVDAFQGGAGTSTNMNVNEVIANRAIELLGGEKGDYSLVHPLDHVNLGQSTNDTFPTALRVAAIKLVRRLARAMAGLQGALQAKEKEFARILKTGRTEMQDAVPVTLGQEFGAWAEAVARDWWRLYKAEERLRQVNLGGTAVGTGLNASRRYTYRVIEVLRELTGFGLSRAENTFEATQNADIFAEVSGFLKAAAVSLAKIAGDLRLLSSGPRAGLAEIRLPEAQAGSSIMPGKVNPVIPEMVTQVAFQVMANDAAVGIAAASGQLELNAFLPLIAHNLLQSLTLLANAVDIFAAGCIRGIEADAARCRELLDASQSVITAFVPYIGYEKATALVLRAAAARRPVTDLLVEEGLFSPDEIEVILRPEELTTPGIAGARYFRRKRGGDLFENRNRSADKRT
ncbi:MAG: aspartate ammonia-lyase [Bacillota bacterium]|uniref:aspartate ammonia-lyase n=1 Tax=Desulforudis sp. DRI-14 TaxID=3459793 RepID=UPI00346FDD5F